MCYATRLYVVKFRFNDIEKSTKNLVSYCLSISYNNYPNCCISKKTNLIKKFSILYIFTLFFRQEFLMLQNTNTGFLTGDFLFVNDSLFLFSSIRINTLSICYFVKSLITFSIKTKYSLNPIHSHREQRCNDNQ